MTGRFQSLMNAGVRIPPFIEAYTGITNDMVRAAPPAAECQRKALPKAIAGYFEDLRAAARGA